jgi:protein SCO1/2
MWRAAVLVLTVSLASCGRSSSTEGKRYELVGQILSVSPERREVVIRHEDIKGFMMGMTMPFTVEDAALLNDRERGDLVTATLVVGERVYLSEITKTGHAPIEEPPAGDRPALLRPGDLVADEPLIDQHGASRPLASLRGHRVALTFVYTRCPVPNFCPLMNRNFAAVQKVIRADRELADVQLVTVTLDPAYDRPAVLEAHARVFGADPAWWSFLTGDPADVKRFSEQFGIDSTTDASDPSQIVHNLRTAVIGPDGRFVKSHTGNEWTPADLIADLKSTPAPSH